jgi:hypothetical protein
MPLGASVDKCFGLFIEGRKTNTLSIGIYVLEVETVFFL